MRFKSVAVFLAAILGSTLLPVSVEAHFGYPLEVCQVAKAAGRTWVEVDITTQSLYVFENGRPIRRIVKNISTANVRDLRFHKGLGKKIIPKEPRGCFKIEGKEKKAYSEAYGVTLRNAVWFGGPGVKERAYAIHCVLPGKEQHLGHPNSGGCIRTPYDFCEWFYAWAKIDVPVWIYGEWTGPYKRK